jgi:hypothetical protein
MKRAMKGEFDLFGEAEKNYNNLSSFSNGIKSGETYYEGKIRNVKNFKKAILICIHGASTRFGKTLINEQEVLNNIAEMMMETYVTESLALRVEKMETVKGNVSLYKDMLDVNLSDTASIVRKSALEAIGSFSRPDTCQSLIKAIDNLTRVECINVKDARRRIADKLIEDNTYKF